MKFINLGEPIKVRFGSLIDCYWKTLKTNEVIDLPKKYGQRLKLEKLRTTEGQIGDKVVETKQIESDKIGLNRIKSDYTLDDLFFKELTKINGIGKKTAEDIVTWGTKEKLIQEIEKEKKLPFRNDIEILLKKKFLNIRGEHDKRT